MKTLRKISILWVLLVVATGCTSMVPPPENNLERLTYAESGYDSVLDTVTRLRAENRLTDSQKKAITHAFDNYTTARNVAKEAIRLGDSQGFNTSLQAVNSALAVVRQIITEAEQ